MAIEAKSAKSDIIYFWLPRALSCLIIISIYKIFHLSTDLNVTPKSALVTPDFSVYENSFRFNFIRSNAAISQYSPYRGIQINIFFSGKWICAA